jgi:nitrite reductase/ring-hydroxylating ferredoxin subunit
LKPVLIRTDRETAFVATTLLCQMDALPDGDSRGFDPAHSGRDTVIVVRQGRRLHGWRNACPHIDGAPMAWRKDAYLNAERNRIVCHAHGAQFEIDSGLCTLGPCLGQHLTAVPLSLTPTGEVHIASPSQETPS